MVEVSPKFLEWCRGSKTHHRHSVSDRCVSKSLGRPLSGKGSSRFLESKDIRHELQLSRADGDTSQYDVTPSQSTGQICSGSLRQCGGSGLRQFSRRTFKTPDKSRQSNLVACFGKQDTDSGKAFVRFKQHVGRQFVPPSTSVRVEASSSPLEATRHSLGPSYRRQIWVPTDDPASTLQQPLLGSNDGGCRRVCTGLEPRQQLCQSAISADSSSPRHHSGTKGLCNSHRTLVAQSALVSEDTENGGGSPCSPTKTADVLPENGAPDRARKELSMADLRLESVWYDRLKGTGWTDRSSRQISFHWAESTISAYDRQINKFASFCRKRIGVFPPADKDISAVLADFLCVTADSSDRPESVLKVTSAAISCY